MHALRVLLLGIASALVSVADDKTDNGSAEFRRHVKLSLGPAETEYVLWDVELIVPQEYSPRPGAQAQYWKSDIVLRDPSKNRGYAGIVGFRWDHQGTRTRKLFVSLSKEQSLVAEARIWYRSEELHLQWCYTVPLGKSIVPTPKEAEAGADQPATKPANKAPSKTQPSTPPSKDGPR